MNPIFKDYLLEITKASACEEQEMIQSLWSGYGNISRYQLVDSSHETVVVKHISLNQPTEHPRGWDTEFAHQRKVKSYEVETLWYQKWARNCNNHCYVPKFIGSFSQGKNQWIILEDLNVDFPIRKQQVDLLEVKVCLKWLANFHMSYLGKEPEGLWQVGTYWNLETRPNEFEKIKDVNLKLNAHKIDDMLNQCTYMTIVHGDAKLANFCFSATGKEVAAVDFQYVGGGCGMKDVAYFMGSCLSGEACDKYEKELLDFYFLELKKALNNRRYEMDTDIVDFAALEKEWRLMYPVACTDFTRFLLGWMPTHQKLNSYSRSKVNEVLKLM